MNRFPFIPAPRGALFLFAVAVLALFAVGSPGANPAAAQQLTLGVQPAAKTAPGSEASLPAASEYRPERVRMHLLAYHGFSKAQLDAASTRVPELLMGWIDDPEQPMLLRRQAIKALRFYADDETFAFIDARMPAAPPALQQLFLGSLEAFAPARAAELDALLGPMLDSEDVVVRYAAVSLAAKLSPSPAVQEKLQARLAVEPDPALRGEIRSKLRAP